MQDGFVKIAAATPDLRVADCAYNASEIIEQAKQAAARGAHLIVFPELCLTATPAATCFCSARCWTARSRRSIPCGAKPRR